jgi:hypothetical protein
VTSLTTGRDSSCDLPRCQAPNTETQGRSTKAYSDGKGSWTSQTPSQHQSYYQGATWDRPTGAGACCGPSQPVGDEIICVPPAGTQGLLQQGPLTASTGWRVPNWACTCWTHARLSYLDSGPLWTGAARSHWFLLLALLAPLDCLKPLATAANWLRLPDSAAH